VCVCGWVGLCVGGGKGLQGLNICISAQKGEQSMRVNALPPPLTCTP
jgi:hypothetical protein